MDLREREKNRKLFIPAMVLLLALLSLTSTMRIISIFGGASMSPRWRQNPMLSMYYARTVAFVFVLIGLLGFTKVTGWAWAPNLYHLGLGLIFGYAGFFVRERNTVLQITEGLGILMVVAKGITFLGLLVVGQAIHWGTVEVSCFVVGIGSILAARYLRASESGRRIR